jgi:predicted MFS family arabinose efflux permease
LPINISKTCNDGTADYERVARKFINIEILLRIWFKKVNIIYTKRLGRFPKGTDFMETGKNRQLSNHSRGYRWAILSVIVYSFIVYTIAFQSVPPIIPTLIKEFSVTDGQAGFIMSVAVIPGLLLSLPSGWLLNKYREKKVGVVALVFVAVASIVTAISNSFEMLLFGRLLLGFGGILITVTGYAIISRWFDKKDLGKAMGLLGASIPIAVIITFPSVSLAVADFGWRFPFYITSLLAVTVIVLFVITIKDGARSEDREIKVERKDYLNLELWKLGLVCLGVQGAAFSFSTWAPTLFTEFAHMPSVQASFLAGLSGLSGIFLIPFFGYLSDRTEKRRPFLILGPLLLTVALVALAMGSNVTLVGSVLLVGVASSIIAPVVNVMPQEILGRNKAGIGFGVITVCGSLGLVLSAPLIGFLIDASDSLAVSLFGMCAFSIAAVVLSFTLKTR